MTYLALARKWRPRTFSELTGQTHVVRALSNALDQGRLHHAWLFTGTRGTGKTTLARILAKALNCEQGVSAQPCGECSACRQVDAGRFVDLIELDAASNTGIDNMRDVLDNAQYMPTVGRFKVYIIDEVHMLSKAAFNSMLKTLEEPPAHVKFILATTDPQKIPITVLSRCLQFNLKQLSPALIQQRMTQILTAENITADPAALQQLARAAQGSMRDALSLLDQAIAWNPAHIQTESVLEMLGTLDHDTLLQLIRALQDGDANAVLQQANDIIAQNADLGGVLQELARLLHQIALCQIAPDTLENDLPIHQALREMAASISPDQVQLYYQICLLGKRDLPLAPDEAAGFSMTLLRMLAFSPAREYTPPPAPIRPTAAHDTPVNIAKNGATAAATQSATTVLTQQETIQDTVQDTVQDNIQNMSSDDTPNTTPTKSPQQRSLPQHAADWQQLVEDMKPGAQARMLALECEWQSSEEDKLYLLLPHSHKHLAQPGYQSKLREALTKYFARPIHLILALQETVSHSPQRIVEKDRAQRQADAETSVQQDRFIQEAIEHMGARMVSTRTNP